MARLAVRHPPSAQQRAERAVGVRDFDEEVTARPQDRQRGAQLFARVAGVLQMVEHAHDVVAGAQPPGDPRVGEPAAVGLLDVPGRPCLLDPPGGVEAVEGRVRVDLPGDGREVPVPGADVEPALRLGVREQRAGCGAVASSAAAGAEEPVGEAVESLVEVPVVEGQSLRAEPRVLEGVGAVRALVDDERAGLALHLVRRPQPGAQPVRAAPGTVRPARLVEPVGASGEFGRVGGAALGARGWRGGHGRSWGRQGGGTVGCASEPYDNPTQTVRSGS